jgi:hypothetical protein
MGRYAAARLVALRPIIDEFVKSQKTGGFVKSALSKARKF